MAERSTLEFMASMPLGRLFTDAYVQAYAFAAVAIGFVVARVFDPQSADSVGRKIPGCLLLTHTGLDCPGCGATRAVHDLAHGNVVEAIDHNAMIVVGIPLAIYTYVAWNARRFGRNIPMPGLKTTIAFVSAMVIFGIVRNLPIDAVLFLDSRA